ncbi:ATP-binding cassette subfamily C protein CydCD [Actinoplanes lutulentus]|nr:thiol reductant ABC exporter subunit CydC [Actinoplanes lutulentus]MBB2943686.1 ATP-binding cassette subfamily C protein CydCD [Actinoplanes lutulentus]
MGGGFVGGSADGSGRGAVSAGVLLLAGAFVARAVLAWAEQVVARRTAARVTDELRRSMLDAVVRRGPAWVADYGSGRLATVLGTGLDALKPWFSGYLPAVALGVILPPLVILVMFVVDPASAIIALLTLPLIPLLGALIGWATQARARQRWVADARLAGHFLDVVRGLATLKVFGRAERQTAVIADLTDQHRRATMRVLRVAFLSSTALDLVGTLSVGLIAVQAGLRVAAGSMELAPALLVILLAPEAYRPLREMAARYHAATDATAVIADVDEILTASSPGDVPAGRALEDQALEYQARGDRAPEDRAQGDQALGDHALGDRALGDRALGGAAFWGGSGRWGVRVSGLRARYPGSVRDAVFLPELTVRAGEAVALRGPSGAGKTTVLRVLAGLHPAETGALAVGCAFYLPQRPSLPHARTVAEVFPPDSSPAEIADALRTVGLNGEVTASTPLSEHGAGISSGQRQRLALAALLHRASTALASLGAAGAAGSNGTDGAAGSRGADGAVSSSGLRARPVVTLLLDEPTAHLDAAAEKLVIARLRDLAGQGCALLVVAHRPALLSAADRVVTLNPPDAAEQGGRRDVQPAALSDSRSARDSQTGPAEQHGRHDVQPAALSDSRAARDSQSRPAEQGGRRDVQPAALSDSQTGTAEQGGRPDVQPAALGDSRGGGGSVAVGSVRGSVGSGQRWERLRRPWVAVGLGAGASLAGVLLTGAAAWLLVRASSLPPVLTLSGAVVLVRGSAVARPLLRYLERLVSHDLAFARLGRRRARVYADLIPRVPGRRAHRRGDLLTKLVDDVDAQVDGLLRGRLPAYATAATVVVAGLAALGTAPAVVVPLAVGVLIAGVLAPAVAAWQAGRLDAATGAARASLRDAVVETVDGIEEVGSGSARSSVPMDRSRTLAELEARAARESGLAAALAHLGWGAAAAGTALVLARSGLSAEWSAVVLLGMITLGETVVALPEAAIARRQAAGAARRVGTLTAQPPASAMVTLSEASPSSGPDLRVRNLTAGWDRDLPPVLDGFDLELPAGSRTAVTGRSGSGKSTLAAVLGRLIDPWAGTVAFDGKTVLVGDETGHVFASTVRENLRLAAPSATDAQLVATLTRVGLGAWVAALPDGLDTWLGTGGSTISGGQRRRLATARALLAEPDLLILDEPTEGIDEAGAQELMADLLGAASGRTVLIFAHRAEGLDLVDRVIDLQSIPYQATYARMD